MTRSALARQGTGPIVELMDWSTEGVGAVDRPTLSSTCLTEVSIDVGQIVDANSSRPVQVVALLQRTAYRELFPPSGGLLDSFFDVFLRDRDWQRLLAGSLPQRYLCQHPPALLYASDATARSTHMRALAHGSVHCPDPWQHCHELHPSTCVETATGKCECVCGWGSTLIPAPHATPRADELGGATDVLWRTTRATARDTGAARRSRMRTTCGPTGCWPRSTAGATLQGQGLETVCRTLQAAATCKEMGNNETNRSDCQCICPPGYVAHPFPAGGGGTPRGRVDRRGADAVVQQREPGRRHAPLAVVLYGRGRVPRLQAPSATLSTRAEGNINPITITIHHHHHHQHHHGGHEWLGEALPGLWSTAQLRP